MHGSAWSLLLVAGLSLAARPSPAGPPVIRESNVANARLGWSVAAAGDVNNDGRVDVIAGAPGYSSGGINTRGAVFLFLGSATGFANTEPQITRGEQAGASFGAAVCGAGDLNGDGYFDVLVGAPGWDNGQVDEGKVFVYLGGPTGLSATAFWSAESNQAGAHFGAAVASSRMPGGPMPGAVVTGNRTFNGDSLIDIVVGAPGWDNGQADEGKVFVYYGLPTVIRLPPTASWTHESNQAGAELGGSLAAAGWVNGDAHQDLLVGAMYHDGVSPNTDQGRAYLFYGGATGLGAVPGWTRDGDGPFSYFGGTVAAAGDVNNNGRADILVGAWAYIPQANQDTVMGRAYLFLGADNGPSQTPAWTRIAALEETYHGFSLGMAGRFNGDSLSDVVVGAPRQATSDSDEGLVEVFYGNAQGLPASPSWSATGGRAPTMLGFAAGSAADLDGNGSWDLIVGAPAFGSTESGEGALYVYLNP